MFKPIKANPDNLHGYRIRIYPNEEQKARIKEISDLYRFVFNKTVAILFSHYHDITEEEYFEMRNQGLSDRAISFKLKDKPKKKSLSFPDMCKIIGKFRNENDWLKAIPINIARYAIRNVFIGYSTFFKSRVTNLPYIKKKRLEKQTFSCRGERVYFRKEGVKLEGIHTLIDYGSFNPPKGRLYSCTITCNNDDKYWLSFQTELYSPIQFLPREGPIGVDVGMRKLITLSDGTIYKPLDTKQLEQHRRKKQSRVTKDRNLRLQQSREAKTKLENIPMSKRMKKRYIDYRELTNHIWNKRNTYIHQITREIVNRRPSVIVIEDLNVEALRKKFKGSPIDVKEYIFAKIHTQLEYKARWENIPVIKAPRSFPSTKQCSVCGNKYNVGKSEIYCCPKCGLIIDRDINAALNLRNLAT